MASASTGGNVDARVAGIVSRPLSPFAEFWDQMRFWVEGGRGRSRAWAGWATAWSGPAR